MSSTTNNESSTTRAVLTGAVGLGTLLLAGAALQRQPVERKKYQRPGADTFGNYDKGVHWAVKPDDEISVKFSKSGLASQPATTVLEVFARSAKQQGATVAMKTENPDGSWKSYTWSEYHSQSMRAARAFIKLGLEQFQSVNIIGFNSPEYFIANMGAIAAGGKAAGIYTTNGPEACKYIVLHSSAAVIVAENEAQLDKFMGIRDELKCVKAFVQYKGAVADKHKQKGVLSWDAFLALGGEDDEEEKRLSGILETRIRAQKPGHCCTLIYTSGTTGPPKAVMISHDNINYACHCTKTCLPGDSSMEEHLVSYLPLSHIAAQIVDLHMPICLTGNYNTPATTWFARPDALKGSLGITLKAARPTQFVGVPRVWEKFMEKMKEIGSKTTGFKKTVATWAKEKGLQGFLAAQIGGDDYYPRLWWLAQKLVFSKVRANLGFDRCRSLYSSAAPIAQDTLKFFHVLNLPVVEVFGMSECTGPQTTCWVGYNKIGSVGLSLPGCELMIDHVDGRDKAGEGEICFRGRHIMMGYMNDAKKTQEAIDDRGWLHSGDVGRVDEHGLVYITGRIKELIITAGGENIAPVPIEDTVKSKLPALSNVIMIGDRRKYNVMLVTLKSVVDLNTGLPTDELTGDALQVSDAKTVSAAKKDPKWRDYIQKGLDKANKEAVSNAQKIQKFEIVSEFAIPTGELTPTLKLKRAVVHEKYKALIDEFYANDTD